MIKSNSFLCSLCILVAAVVLFWGLATCSGKKGENGTPENCANGMDDDGDVDADCDAAVNERCIDGCCYAVCPPGVTPCTVNADCPTDRSYVCVTGCCIEMMT